MVMLRKWPIAIYTIIWWGGGVLWKLSEERLTGWANNRLDEGLKAMGWSVPKLIVWVSANPIWTVSIFVGMYVFFLFSLLLIPKILLSKRSRVIEAVESFIQADKLFIDPETRQLLASGDVAVVRIVNRGLPANIVPEIRFRDSHARSLTLEGRWTDSELPPDPQAAVQPITIGTGGYRLLDVAIRFSGEGLLWFGLDNHSPFAMYRVPEYSLISPIIVEVVISGSVGNKIIRTEWFFVLVSDGSLRILRVKSERAAMKLVQNIASYLD